VITNAASDSYQQIYVIAHIICNNPVRVCVVTKILRYAVKWLGLVHVQMQPDSWRCESSDANWKCLPTCL